MEIVLAVVVVGGVIFAVGMVLIGYINNLFSLKDNVDRLRGRAPVTATRDDVERLEAKMERVEGMVGQIKEVFNHYTPVAEESSRKLVVALLPEREESLRLAIEAQAEHRYADAVRHLRECVYDGMPAAERASIHNLIGNGLIWQGLAIEAEREYIEALAAAHEVGDRETEAVALGNLGLVYLQRWDLERAEQHFEQAVKTYCQMGDRLSEAAFLGNLGLVYRERGELRRAEEHHRRALGIDREMGDSFGEAKQLGNLSAICVLRGDLGGAEEHAREALRIEEGIGDRLGQADQLSSLGIVCSKRGDLEGAEEHLREALKIQRDSEGDRQPLRRGLRLGQPGRRVRPERRA